MARPEVSRRFVRGGLRSVLVESVVVAALIGGAYLLAVVLERML